MPWPLRRGKIFERYGRINPKNTLVVGLGNPLMGDDGIGVAVARDLRSRRSLGVRVVEGGTPGFNLVDLLIENLPVIFLDAVDAGLAPGSVFWVDPAEILNEASRHSLHQITLADVLELLGKPESARNLRIIGIQPERIGPGLDLSPALEVRLDEIIGLAETMINEALAIGQGESDIRK